MLYPCNHKSLQTTTSSKRILGRSSPWPIKQRSTGKSSRARIVPVTVKTAATLYKYSVKEMKSTLIGRLDSTQKDMSARRKKDNLVSLNIYRIQLKAYPSITRGIIVSQYMRYNTQENLTTSNSNSFASWDVSTSLSFPMLGRLL